MRLLSSIWSGYSLTSSQLHFEANSSVYPEEAGVVGYLCTVSPLPCHHEDTSQCWPCGGCR